MDFNLWSLAGLDQHGDRMEAAVTAARIAASEGPHGDSGAVFAPLAMGGARGLRTDGLRADRLARGLDGMESACLTAMRQLDDIEAWSALAESVMTGLFGKTSHALRAVLAEWPLFSAQCPKPSSRPAAPLSNATLPGWKRAD